MQVIRNIVHNKRDYVVVSTTLQIEEGEDLITTPIYIRADVTGLSKENRTTVFGKLNMTFNHLLAIRSKQTSTIKKPWWKTIFN